MIFKPLQIYSRMLEYKKNENGVINLQLYEKI